MLTSEGVTASDVTDVAGDSELVTASIRTVTSDTGDIVTPALPGITETDRTGISGQDDFIIDLTTEDSNFYNSTHDATFETGGKTSISDGESTTQTGVTSLNPGAGQSCANNVCRNGGTCLTSIDGFQCHCR